MSVTKFEHPLNEKTRIYLRVESLLDTLTSSSHFEMRDQHLLFFRSLFDLLEIFDQIQLKSELAKDLEKQRLTYKSWLNIEGVNQDMLGKILADIDIVHSSLLAAERFGHSLKEDRFLSTIRQRFNLPGGACCFDLPALHHWLHLESEGKQADIQRWLGSLEPLKNALNLWLKLTRETGLYHKQHANNGFFQSDADEANILRLSIPLHYGAYPMISGHKSRFAIKFLDFRTGQAINQDIAFELAVCS
ncbi:cell division protein ZapD [Vibrio sp. FNV 38]|nr:cell division protein ZapD [Vibrio sp. FNV 38]